MISLSSHAAHTHAHTHAPRTHTHERLNIWSQISGGMISFLEGIASRALTVQIAWYAPHIAARIELVGRCNCIQGKAALPVPKKDYWALTTYANTTSAGDNNTSRAELLVFDETGLTEIPSTPAFFAQCSTNPARCKGGFECNPGYEGIMCSECAIGQFYFRGACDVNCSDIEPQGVVTVFGILAVVAVWVILNKSAGGAYAANLLQLRHKASLRRLRLRFCRYECLDVGVSYVNGHGTRALLAAVLFECPNGFTQCTVLD